MRCVLRDIEGLELIAPAPLSLRAEMDERTPADALYVTFPYIETGELTQIDVYADEKPVFRGIVDEQRRSSDHQGVVLEIAARSPAAYLLDNEAAPCVYDHPSAQLIYERYAQPFGIAAEDHDDAVYFGEQNVLKGSSCWSVLKQFCIACYSAIPRISATGKLRMRGLQTEELTRFGEGGVGYTECTEISKRCEELSAVWVKTSDAGMYSLPIENKDAISRGIRRVRYLNAVLTQSPMRCADDMIRNGKAKAYEIRLRCPSCLLGCEGNAAAVSDPALGERSDLYISALRYRWTADGEYSDVTLKRRNGDVD